MFTAAYVTNRAQHSALNMGSPHKALRGKRATLQHIWTIGSRDFGYIKKRTN